MAPSLYCAWVWFSFWQRILFRGIDGPTSWGDLTLLGSSSSVSNKQGLIVPSPGRGELSWSLACEGWALPTDGKEALSPHPDLSLAGGDTVQRDWHTGQGGKSARGEGAGEEEVTLTSPRFWEGCCKPWH